MPMSRVFYQWSAADERWQECVGWLPKELHDEIFAVTFDDEASMVMWSEEEGKLKALSTSQKKLADKQAQRLLQNMEPEKHDEVQEAVSPSLSSPCFVSDGGMMATLDPSCHEQFWCQLGSARPNHLVLRPSRERQSLCLACEAAEWQHLNGKAFLLVHSEQDREYVEEMLDSDDLRGRRVQCRLPDGLAMTGNSEYFLKSAMEAKMRKVSFTAQDIDGLSQNQKAHQENVDGLHQNQEAHHENVDGLRQNQEAHHVVVNFDVCQEHSGGQQIYCQEHGGGLSSEVECFASASEMAEVEEAASRLMRQKDYSMISLEKFLCESCENLGSGVGQFSSVFAEEEDESAEAAGEDAEAELEPSAEQADWEPTAEEKRLVKKLHDNLGHPAPREMARSLRLATAKPHIIRYVARDFRCSVCESRIKPKPARPAVLPKIYEPGRIVGVDVIFLSALNRRETFPALNITDWGTSYQVVERLKSTEATHTWRTFMRVWCRTFGVPDVIVTDLGSEFRGQFADLASHAGALVRHTAARSPWQAGKTERAGAHFKLVYEKARENTYIGSWEEVKTLMYAVECAKNRYGNRSGFSPMQRQIGHNLRLPGSLRSHDSLDPAMVVASADAEMKKALEIRAAAQEAYIKSQTEVALSKAKNARSRVQVQFSAGETVYVYRQPKMRKRKHAMTPESLESRKPVWVGPGIVLVVETPSLWISMKGELWKLISFEQRRHATSEEQIAKEILAGELEALKEELGRTTHKRTFRDMTGLGAPGDEDDDALHQEAERYDSLDGGGSLQRPAQRQRRGDGRDVAIPEDSELDYEPSEKEQEGDPVPEQPPHAPQPQNLRDGSVDMSRRTTESEPEPVPVQNEAMEHRPILGDPVETAQQVMRNERLDGNPPGSAPYEAARRIMQHRPEGRHHPYFAEKGDKWTWEPDVWEEVSNDIVIRQHNFPKKQLCNPAKVRGALMPRRLKYRATYMVDENGEVHVHGDNWFKNRKKPCKTNYSWVGFTVLSAKEIDVQAFASGKNRGQGEVFEHEIKAEEWPGWRISDKQEWDKVAQTNAVKVLSVEESRRIRADPVESQRILPSRMVRRWKPAEQPGAPDVQKSRAHSWGSRSRHSDVGTICPDP
ncbi:ankrd29 [Symbiodinium sp. CCMP2456]|nr:ankrd29 [Symbiodinium sp. CCMP2456]